MPPADEATLDKPSEALEVVWEAVSFAFVAASEVVEACLRLFLRRRNRDCRMTAREVHVAGIVAEAPIEAAQDAGESVRARSAQSERLGYANGGSQYY